MRVIGLIGGMSWESSAVYYRLVNEATRARLGGLHSARSLMYSVDMAAVEQMQRLGQWAEAGELVADAACRLERGGADFVVLCTNTMHKLAEQVERAVAIPLLHIADATAREVKAAGVRRVGLLGTAFTMEQDFYKGRLVERFGLEALVPDEADRQLVHRVIYEELCQGRVLAESRRDYARVLAGLVARGAQGVILGCTEIGLLVGQQDCTVPVFDTTTIHARAAVDFALSTEVRS